MAIASRQDELELRSRFLELFRSTPIPESELLANLALYVNRQNLARLLFMDHLYRQILEVHGVAMEFGVRWGHNLALLVNLRGIHEPFNYSRRIVGFDTFEGFPAVHPKDGRGTHMQTGAYDVTEDYESYLQDVLAYHEQESPIAHIRKFELCRGDAQEELTAYLERHPETIVAFAYFDLDLYEPTRRCLEIVRDRLVRGSVIGFDELCSPHFPGETIALGEVLGLPKVRLKRVPWHPNGSYLVVD